MSIAPRRASVMDLLSRICTKVTAKTLNLNLNQDQNQAEKHQDHDAYKEEVELEGRRIMTNLIAGIVDWSADHILYLSLLKVERPWAGFHSDAD